MIKAYKYRANCVVKRKKRDTVELSENVFYAANLRVLNDPFEGSVELPRSERYESWVTPLTQKIYDVGIYSLSMPKDGETFPNNELLWAHYANSHRGFCIEYDLDILTQNQSPDFNITDQINVAYENERPKVLETDNTSQVQKKVFGTKSLEWKYENEIRLVFNQSGLKPVAEKAIKAIYFGLNISFEDRRNIIKKMSGKNIDFYQVERIDDLYKLKATKLLFDYSHEIVNKELNSYMILYKSPNKDKNTILEFVAQFRKKTTPPTNITIIDDIRVKAILQNYTPRSLMSPDDIELQSKHWIAYSVSDAPESVWMYPEK